MNSRVFARPLEKTEQEEQSSLLPGQTATTIRISSLVNSLPRWILKTNGSFRSFLLSIVTKPLDSTYVHTSADDGEAFGRNFNVWPMPAPYPEVFTKKGDSKDWWVRKLVCLQVLLMSWLHLGSPSGAPAFLKLGSRLSRSQWSVVKTLRHLVVDGNTPIQVEAADMGRTASKIESMEQVISTLASSLGSLQVDVDGGYNGGPSRPAVFDDDWLRCGDVIGSLRMPSASTAKPIVASRLTFPGPPGFDPVPFFDVNTANAFCNPLDSASCPSRFQGEVPRVQVNATQEERWLLYKKLAESGRLFPVPADGIRKRFLSGLFSVLKDAHRDRLILDARPPNMLERVRTAWCQSMASGQGLCDLVLRPGHTVVASGLDLKDYFYQFKIGAQRLLRNTLAAPLDEDEAMKLFGPALSMEDGKQWVALGTLAMGDLNACEFAQCSHVGMMIQAGMLSPESMWTLRSGPPRTLTTAGIIIDDLVVLEQVMSSLAEPMTESEGKIELALKAYAEAGLETNPKKAFLKEPCSRFWGIELDGSKGIIRSSSLRLWPLIMITMRVAMLRLSSVKLMEMLAGSWVSVISCRRRMLCLMDLIFEPLGIDDARSIIRLSPGLVDELVSLAVLGPLACTDLRSPFLPFVGATDASLQWMAAVRADVDEQVVQELGRHALKKSTWSKLLPTAQAWLRSKGLLDPEDELPDGCYNTHPLWTTVARCLTYKERWRMQCPAGKHINCLELKAYLLEEKRVSTAYKSKRYLSGLDSQVCLGALVKGRSSSPSLNRLLRSNLCYPLGSAIFNYHMYYPSEYNRADGPTRHSAPAAPDVEAPEWMEDLSKGSTERFDEWMKGLPKIADKGDLDFDALKNGKEVDLRPMSKLPSFERRREKRSTATLASIPLCVDDAPAQSSLCAEALEILASFNEDQIFRPKGTNGFLEPGGLDLFSGSCGVAKQMVRAGAPWIITFEWQRSSGENLLDEEVRQKIRRLLHLGAISTLGMAPICASFSTAITPPVRSSTFPRGKPGLSAAMRLKVKQGNSHGDFVGELVELCIALGVYYFLENPDCSWLWSLKPLQRFRPPDSPETFRLDYCRLGTPWKKATKIATNTGLAALRMKCICKRKHQQLRGYSKVHGCSWTHVAEPYPRGLSLLLGRALCIGAGWCKSTKLCIPGCCRSKSQRIGEASNPGPPRRANGMRQSLEELPLLSAGTQALEARQLRLFLDWCEVELTTMDVSELFDLLPAYLGQILRTYGDILYQQHGALSNYRHLLLAVQRWKPTARPFLQVCWELVRRWEHQEPVSHRTPVPEAVLQGLIVGAFLHGWYEWCGVALLAFYGAGRVGEVLRCRRGDLVLPDDCFGNNPDTVFLQLRSFKSLTRQAARIQHMRIKNVDAVKLLRLIYLNYPTASVLFHGSSHQFRRRWDFMVNSYGIGAPLRLTPGGLRGGAAVAAYREGRHVNEILWALRLKNLSTLESYLQEVASLTFLNSLSEDSRLRLRSASSLFPFLADCGKPGSSFHGTQHR